MKLKKTLKKRNRKEKAERNLDRNLLKGWDIMLGSCYWYASDILLFIFFLLNSFLTNRLTICERILLIFHRMKLMKTLFLKRTKQKEKTEWNLNRKHTYLTENSLSLRPCNPTLKLISSGGVEVIGGNSLARAFSHNSTISSDNSNLSTYPINFHRITLHLNLSTSVKSILTSSIHILWVFFLI